MAVAHLVYSVKRFKQFAETGGAHAAEKQALLKALGDLNAIVGVLVGHAMESQSDPVKIYHSRSKYISLLNGCWRHHHFLVVAYVRQILQLKNCLTLARTLISTQERLQLLNSSFITICHISLLIVRLLKQQMAQLWSCLNRLFSLKPLAISYPC
jgi:hypothetical protein